MRRVAPAILLFVLAALAYWPVVHCGFIWDDDDYVTQNPVLRTAAGIFRIWFEPTSLPQYYPLVHTTFWLEYRLWGPNPLGYHVVNVLLHFASSLLLLRLVQRLAIPGALFATALFAVHPVHVESVAWVTERKNVLSAFFMLLAASQWFRWHETNNRRTWWQATACFVAALLAKTVTAPLPFALLVVQWWRHGRITKREIHAVLPWIALGIAAGLFTAWLEATHVGATGAEWQLAGAERFLVAGRAVWFYLASLAWPLGLCFNYPRWQLDTAAFWQWVPVIGAIAAPIAAVLLRTRLGRGPAAALLLFGGMLVPALGFFDVYPFRFSFTADHFQYHASIAMLVALSAGATLMANRFVPATTARVVAGLVVLLLAVAASVQASAYRDLETSWRTTLACNPESMLALINLGGLLLQRNDLPAAQHYLEQCIRLYPDNEETLGNLGQIAHRNNDLAKARQFYEASLAQRGDGATVLHNLALLELQEGKPKIGLPIARRVVDLAPDMYEGHATLARIAFAGGEWQESVDQADWILKRTPAAHDIRQLAAQGLLKLGNVEGAMQNAGAVLAAMPGLESARETFAVALARLLQNRPPAGLTAQVVAICQSGGLDPAPLMPRIARALRALGRTAQAEALER